MNILLAPHPMLSKVCRSDFTIDDATIKAMFLTMRENNGIGLAAPQVGIDARLFVTGWNQVFVNPVIERMWEPLMVGEEACLSIPGKTFVMVRHGVIKMATGEMFGGLKAIVIQHELNHLDGILINEKQ